MALQIALVVIDRSDMKADTLIFNREQNRVSESNPEQILEVHGSLLPCFLDILNGDPCLPLNDGTRERSGSSSNFSAIRRSSLEAIKGWDTEKTKEPFVPFCSESAVEITESRLLGSAVWSTFTRSITWTVCAPENTYKSASRAIFILSRRWLRKYRPLMVNNATG